MKTLGSKLCAILVGCVAFAACTNATPPQETPVVSSDTHLTGPGQTSSKVLRRASATETVLYRFGSQQPDGAQPIAALTYRDGTMYGVTYEGIPSRGHSVLYSITPSGKYTILHTFDAPEGFYLEGKLKDVGHNLFGMALVGGTYGCGTVFESTLSGGITVLHSFLNSPGDGCYANSHLVDVNGTLYGTTQYGGSGTVGEGFNGDGTVFSITPSGSEKVIYNFVGGSDGYLPQAGGLVEVNGVLYGTTALGGNGVCAGNGGCGTVFSITPGGKESVLHRFVGGSDGAYPAGQLVNVNGTLYGTTQNGGGRGCSSASANAGCGTFFSITPSGSERVLYKFGGPPNDGAGPNGDLIYVSGTMYGTTYRGGSTRCGGLGCGTVFSITPSGTQTVLYSFVGGQDGRNPSAGVIDVNGTLYGTTEYGGGFGRGIRDGTIYSITL